MAAPRAIDGCRADAELDLQRGLDHRQHQQYVARNHDRAADWGNWLTRVQSGFSVALKGMGRHLHDVHDTYRVLEVYNNVSVFKRSQPAPHGSILTGDLG